MSEPANARRGARGYGHDQTPHEGGARAARARRPRRGRAAALAGEFGGHDYGFRPADDQEFDPDYLIWREQQMRGTTATTPWRREQHRRYDDDYWKFRAERREDFHQRFQDWRAQREATSRARRKI